MTGGLITHPTYFVSKASLLTRLLRDQISLSIDLFQFAMETQSSSSSTSSSSTQSPPPASPISPTSFLRKTSTSRRSRCTTTGSGISSTTGTSTGTGRRKRNIQWYNPEHTIDVIKQICKEVEKKRYNEKQTVLCRELTQSRDEVLKKAAEKKRNLAAYCTSSNCDDDAYNSDCDDSSKSSGDSSYDEDEDEDESDDDESDLDDIRQKYQAYQNRNRRSSARITRSSSTKPASAQSHNTRRVLRNSTTRNKTVDNRNARKRKSEDDLNEDQDINNDLVTTYPQLPSSPPAIKHKTQTIETNGLTSYYNEQFMEHQPQKNNHSITFKEYRQKSLKVSQSLPPIYIEGTHPERPLSTATIFLKQHYAVEDQKELTFLPYFGDHDTDKEIDDIKDLFDLEKREIMFEHGPEYEQEELHDLIKDTLDLLLSRFGREIVLQSENYNNDRSSSSSGRYRRRKNSTSRDNEKQKKNKNGTTASILPADNLILSNLYGQIAKYHDVEKSTVNEIYESFFYSTHLEDANSKNHNSDDNNNNNDDEKLGGDDTTTNAMSKNSDLCNLIKNKEKSNGQDEGKTKQTRYEDAMDSYRSLFCRRCFIYDCNLHGNFAAPDLKIQTELAIEKEFKLEEEEKNSEYGKAKKTRSGFSFASLNKCLPCGPLTDGTTTLSPSQLEKLTKTDRTKLDPLQEVICEHAYQIFRGEIRNIANTLGTNTTPIKDYIKQNDVKLHSYVQSQIDNRARSKNHNNINYSQKYSNAYKDKKRNASTQSSSSEPKKKKMKQNQKRAMKRYNQTWLKRVQKAEIHPEFYPCVHKEPCSDDTCSCVQNAFFCTKHCVWGEKSRNMFRGCMCKNGQCNTNSCPCFAAQRECDPDLCHNCSACSDPPDRPASEQRCRNDNISMRRHAHLLLAPSGVKNAGWGIYNKRFLKKGSFVHEYIGELISQEEAERRGVLYDKMNRSYLFNLTADSVIDASRKGNKMKFANHCGNKPNCYAKILTVNGDSRVGLFAKENIAPQTELFFDYAYDLSMSNDLIEKSGVVLEWMEQPKTSSIGKKVTEKKHV